MNLLKLAKDAHARITGRGRWTKGGRHWPNSDGGEMVCAIGAIESALGLGNLDAERHPLAQKLIEKMAVLLGWPTYTKANQTHKKQCGRKLSYRQYIEDCAMCIMSYNDNGTQRKVQNLFKRVIALLEKTRKPRKKKYLGEPIPFVMERKKEYA